MGDRLGKAGPEGARRKTEGTPTACCGGLFCVAAVWFVMVMTHSQLSDIGGPIDVIVLLAVAVLGAVGMAILVYTLESLLGSKRTERRLDP